MMITRMAVGIALASAVAAAPAACAGPNSTGSAPVTKTVIDWVVWGTGTPGDSRNNGVSQYSVYCRDHAAGWREVEMAASDKDTTYIQGAPCPAGLILGASGCDQSGQPVNPTDDTAAGEGAAICPQLQHVVTV